jgi:hypothetical protein
MRRRWTAAALQSTVQSALEAHKIFELDVSQVRLMKEAVLTLINHGLEVDEVAARLAKTRNCVNVIVSQWRRATGTTLDQHRALIAGNKATLRAGKAPPKPFRRDEVDRSEVPPDLEPEVYEFMNTIYCASLQREHELQTGETLTLAEVAALSQYEQDRLDRDANIRAAGERWRTRFGR